MNSNQMTYNPQQYETVYGFSTLDELHNFMPELLYDETMFPNEMVAYFRHRMSLLFNPVYVRQQNIYNIYMAQARRVAFNEWRNSRRVQSATPPPPAGVPDILGALNNVFNTAIPGTSTVRVEVPIVPSTPPAQIRRRVTLEPPAVTRANGGAGAGAPGGDSANSPVPPRRQRNPTDFVTANEFLHFTTPTAGGDAASFLNLINSAILGGLDVPITTTVGNGRFWHEVDVTATSAQIDAGSTVLEQGVIGADVNCAICQEHTYADGESSHQWRRLHCAHEFHRECVDSWLEQSVHCPVCRADIREPSGSGGASAPGGGAGGGGSYAAAARRGVTSRSTSTN